jgi:hypothetical protein
MADEFPPLQIGLGTRKSCRGQKAAGAEELPIPLAGMGQESDYY